jgi:hypothetical protein
MFISFKRTRRLEQTGYMQLIAHCHLTYPPRGAIKAPMTDALDHAIESKRAELAEHDGKRERIVIELKALELAASLRPHSHSRATIEPPKPAQRVFNVTSGSEALAVRRGGKPKGAISPAWRSVLARLYDRGPKAYHDFLAAAQTLEITTNPSAVRDRVRALAEMGFLSGNPSEGFIVTEEAATRFGFTKGDGGPVRFRTRVPNESLDPGDHTGDD